MLDLSNVEIFAIAAAAILIGFIVGRLSKTNGERVSNQRLLENEITRWKIDPDWSTILMDKDPIASATRELGNLMKRKKMNDIEDRELQKEGREGVQKIEAIKSEIASLGSTPLNAAYLRELSLSPAMSKMTRLRKKAQKIVAVDLRYTHHEHFLFLIKSGSKKPGLVEEMDDSIIDLENESPYTKNLDFMERQVDAMMEDEEKIDKMNVALGIK